MGVGAIPIMGQWFPGAGRAWLAVMASMHGCTIPGRTPATPDEFWRKLGATAQYGAGNVPVFADCMWDGTQCTSMDAPPSAPNVEMGNGGISDFAVLRHPNSKFPENMSFADNSIRIVGLKQLWSLKVESWLRHHLRGVPQPQNRFWPRWMERLPITITTRRLVRLKHPSFQTTSAVPFSFQTQPKTNSNLL